MAAYHTRSNSFPTRSHPFTSEVEQQLGRLRSSQAASTSSLGYELNSLQDLHYSVDSVLHMPLVQQALAQGQNKKWLDELLNGSLRILDIISIAQTALVQIKESVQGIQSVLRRRGNGAELKSEITKYLASRKAVKKTIHKALRNLKGVENKNSSLVNEENIRMLKEVEAVTLAAFESLLFFISGVKATSKQSSLSLVSKLVSPKRIACEEEANEFEKVEVALSTLSGNKTNKSDNIQNQLKELESSIQDLEEGLESLLRSLIKSRVSLLNILTN